MEGKAVTVRVPLDIIVMVVLILGLNLAQTHVDAATTKSCCINVGAKACYNNCIQRQGTPATCAKTCGCILIPTSTPCPRDYPISFCKLGCASSMCSTISTVQNSDVAEEAWVACNNKCTKLCNEGSIKGSNAVFTA
ncbi:hypothetical protein J5N97_015595 [Dioscorea zingiberensis]|uniref:Acidic protein n=1 Tax=Dioscorea zingiberensis TaxID=325984 RepID=A0A9D5CK93_9LILI|nr:hypothetical protein J5N97_015595 [Dioscorea zingiberensis]